MGLSSTEATAQLAGINTVEELRNLIAQVDIAATGNVTVFYSGDAPGGQNFGAIARDLAGDQGDTRILDNTHVARFLDVNVNSTFAILLENLVGGNPLTQGTPSYNFLYGTEDTNGTRTANGIWDEVSARFAQETVGEVRVLTSPKKEFGVFALSELPHLLDNDQVTHIDGLPRQQLVYLRDSQGIEMVKHAVAANAFAQIDLSGLLAGGFDEYRQFDAAGLEDLLKDDVTRENLIGKLAALDPQSTVNLETGLSALRQAGELSHINGVSRALNKAGYVGGLLSFMLISAQASAAPTRAQAEEIMKEWAVDAAGSEVGAIVASAAAGVALAAFAAVVAPVAAPVAITLTLGASLVGGFFGAEWATDFYDLLDNKDDRQRRLILDRLSELYFGENTDVGATTVPVEGSGFFRIDPAVSVEAMALAAKNSLAWRYALVKLNPFVVPDVDYTALHNANGELDRFDPEKGLGLTDEYLEARAEALHTYVGLFTAGDEVLAGRPYPGGHDIHFLDAELQGDSGSEGAALDAHYTSDFKEQRLFGGEGNDLLIGSTQNDMLFGDAGDDRLIGKGGEDYLEGGAGDDIYIAGDGDRIFDHDGYGQIVFDGVSLDGGKAVANNGPYLSDDQTHQFTLAGTDLLISRLSDGATLFVSNFENGRLGIHLKQAAAPPVGIPNYGTAASEVIYGRIDAGVTDYEQPNAYNLPDHIQGQEGRDWIYAWDDGPQTVQNGVVINSAPDTDIVEGGIGKDFVHGGAGDDLLYATDMVDAVAVRAGGGDPGYGGTGNEEGDFISGQSGRDQLYGSGRLDGLFGGDGDDLIFGGGGDDIIAGDWSAVVSTLSLDLSTYDYDWFSTDVNGNRQLQLFGYNGGSGKDRIDGGDGDDLVWGGAADDVLYGGQGADQLNGDISGTHANGSPWLPGQHHGRDFVSGGEGDDAINGNGGDDTLLGGTGDDVIDGDFRVLIGDDADFLGDDFLDGGPGSDVLSGNGGADVLLGGDDDDALFGDLDGLDAALHGADVLYGGAGADQLIGQGGDDTLHGGSEDDRLFGDDTDLYVLAGDDWLYGGAGADELSGGLGDDRLSGGEGDDSLWGDAGVDRLSGGPGLDYLAGGEGADTYLFSHGDSPESNGELETVVDLPGEGNHIEFQSDVRRGRLSLYPAGDNGDLILRYSASDKLYLHGGLTGTIDTFSFAGDVAIPYSSFLSTYLANARYLEGGAGDDLVFGGIGDDSLTGGAGDDRLVGGDGDDLLDGGHGSNRLIGGAGADTYLVQANPGGSASRFAEYTVIDSLDRSSTVRFGAGIAPTDLHMQFFGPTTLMSVGRQVLILENGGSGDLVDRFEFVSGEVFTYQQIKTLFMQPPTSIVGSAGADLLQGTSGKDELRADAGDDELYAGAGKDSLDGGPGADIMAGGAGSDEYYVDHAADQVVETAGAGYDFVFSSLDYTLPAHVEGLELSGSDPLAGSGNELGNYIAGNSADNLLIGGAGDDWIHGGGGLDVIRGGEGDDELEGLFQVFGGAGNDRIVTSTYISNGGPPIYELVGGPGDDVYQITQPQHMWGLASVVEEADEGEDSVILRADVMMLSNGLPDNVENLRYEFSGDLWFGSDEVLLVGNALNNRIEIGKPNPGSRPELRGLDGDDVLIGSPLDESGTTDGGLFGGDGNDVLYGKGGDDRLEGGAGDDLLVGGSGSDLLIGGAGADTYVFALGDSDVSSGGSIIDDQDGSSVIKFGSGIVPQDLAFEVQGSDLKISYAAEDAFVLKGGGGYDQVAGYAFASGSFFTQQELDRLLNGNVKPVLASGMPDISAFEGRPQSHILPTDLFIDPEGGPLTYSLVAEDGGQLPSWLTFDAVSRSFDVAAHDGDAGNYALRVMATDDQGATASIQFGLAIGNVDFNNGTDNDDVLKGGSGRDNLSSGAGDDRLYANAGDDWVLAGDGADILFGGPGDDSLFGGAGNDVLKGQAGADEMSGGKGDDKLYGRDDNDRLFGDEGNDVLDGQGGDDALAGGPGDDRYYIDSAGDTLIEDPAAGFDRVYSQVNHHLGSHFEDLILRGIGDIAGSGNTLDNQLYGNAGNNSLSGGAGDDRLYGRGGDDRLLGGAGNDVLKGEAGTDLLIGGEGDDRYFLHNDTDLATELEGEGWDRIYSFVDHTLGSHFEELTLQGDQALDGIGNDADNRLSGNSAGNKLQGGAGDDIVLGRDGADRLFGGQGSDRMYGGGGDDLIVGGTGDDRFEGGAGDDTYRIARGDGSDRIRNGIGGDSGDDDTVMFDSGIAPDQIWFSRSGDDLLAQLLGSGDQVRMVAWYTQEAARVDQLVCDHGELIQADQVEQLVNAVAGFGVEQAPVVMLTPDQQTAYSSMVTTYWGTVNGATT